MKLAPVPCRLLYTLLAEPFFCLLDFEKKKGGSARRGGYLIAQEQLKFFFYSNCQTSGALIRWLVAIAYNKSDVRDVTRALAQRKNKAIGLITVFDAI